jgi:hypothetical protein
MDRCDRELKSIEGACSHTCESWTNRCYQGMDGPTPPAGDGNARARHNDVAADKTMPANTAA